MLNLRRWPLFVPLLTAVLALALMRTDVIDLFASVILLLVLLFALLWFRQRLPALLLVLGALWGVADLMFDASRVAVDDTWLTGEMVVTAEVERVEQLSSSQRYLLHDIKRDDGVTLPGKALLYHYRYGAKRPHISIQAGQRIQTRVRWRLPRNYQNPGAFDYRAWCFDRHIALTGSVRGVPELVRTTLPWLENQRQKVRSTIAATGVHDGVLPALLLAERAQVSEQANRVFAATGTAHLLAISGMHIGMSAAWVFALVWFVLTRREAWIVRWPVRNIALLSGCLAAVAYGTMAGWPLPAVRASMMLAAAALAWCLSSRSEPINTLLAALGLILLFDPSAIASLSLWLSFVATASLLLWAGKLRREDATGWRQRVVGLGRSLLWISLLATLATLPLIISSFGRIPVYSLPANMIMVPLYAFFVMPAALLGELCALLGLDVLAVGLMQLSAVMISQGLNILSGFALMPAGELWAVHPPVISGLLYGLGMLASGFFLWRQQRLRAACLATAVLAIFLISVLHEKDIQAPQWIVWDVGQGAASSLLLPGNKVIVVDAPGRSGSRFNGGTTVAAGLRVLGLSHVDVLVLTHAQSDHLGGALSLLRNVNSVGEIWLPDVPNAHADKRIKAIESYASMRAIPIRWMAKGDSAMWKDGVGLTVLWPPRGHDVANANNTSLVLRAELEHGVRMLWPGDIEVQAERSLLKSIVEEGGLSNIDLLLMPHHGSRSSSHEAFVQALDADMVIAQAGVANRYGFPAHDVVQRYQDSGAKVLNTANGAVILTWAAGKQTASLLQWSMNKKTRRDMARVWWNRL